MDRLTNITNTIVDNARKDADDIISNAEEKCIAVRKEYEHLGEAEYNRIIGKAEEQSKNIIFVANSTAKQKATQEMLKAKTLIISDIIALSCDEFLSCEADIYFSYIDKLLDSFGGLTGGEIVFNKKDKERLPEKTRNLLLSKGFSLSERDGDFRGGFIIKHGKIEENCTIDGIVNDKREILIDFINSKMF